MTTKKLNAKAVILKAWKAIAGAEATLHDTTKLDLELTANKLELKEKKLSRPGPRGPRKSNIPEEHKDLAKKIAAEEKRFQKFGYRDRTIRRLKYDHGIEVKDGQVLDNSYLK